MVDRGTTVPLTAFQRQLLAVLSAEPSEDLGYLAGGAALHFEPHSTRFSRDLDFGMAVHAARA